jgi:hypothetical protein
MGINKKKNTNEYFDSLTEDQYWHRMKSIAGRSCIQSRSLSKYVYSQEDIDYVRNELRIIDVINEYVGTHRRKNGHYYLKYCPFHNCIDKEEYSNSFLVRRDGHIFKCYSCGYGTNDVFKLYSDIRGIDQESFSDCMKSISIKFFDHKIKPIRASKWWEPNSVTYEHDTKYSELPF